MAKSVGNLVAELSANVASFEQGIGRAASLLDSQAARMQRALTGVERSVTNMSGVARTAMNSWIVKMGVDAVRANTAWAASIKESSENLGLSTDAAQEFTAIIERGGATSEQASTMLATFVKTLGDAATGSDTAQKSLAKLGITTDDLRSKNVEQLFLKATNALSQFASVAQRNDAAIENFGKQAKSNADALSISSSAMMGFRKEVVAAGEVLDKSFIDSSKETEKQLQAMDRELKVTSTQLSVTLIPALIAVEKALNVAADGWRRLLMTMGLAKGATATEEQTRAQLEYNRALSRVVEIQDRIAANPGLMGDPTTQMQLSNETAELKRRAEALRAANGEVQKQVELTNAAKAAATKGGPAADAVLVGSGMTEGQRALISQMKRDREAAEQAVTDDLGQQAAMRKNITLDEMQDRLKKEQLWVEAGKQGTQEQMQAMSTYAAWVKAKMAEIDRAFETPMQKLAREWENTTKQMQDATARWAQAGVDAVTTFITTGKADFRGFALSVIQDLVKIQIQKAAAGFSGSFGAFFGGLFSGGGASADFAGVGAAPYADGGDYPANRPMLVGEEGPELMLPRTAGTVIPHGAWGGGNTQVSVSVDASGSSVEASQASKRELGQKLADACRSVILQEKRPGGLLGS